MSRSSHDEIVSGRDETIRMLRSELSTERARSLRLESTVVDMKVAGGSIPRSADGLRLERRPQTAIDKAIAENPRAASDPALRRHLGAWAAKEMAREDANEKAIIQRITTWNLVAVERDDDDDVDANDEGEELIAV